MSYSEEDLLSVSALQHLIFCERQCALIHIEGVWTENYLTALGRVMHERVDEPGVETRRDIKIEYGMPLRSLALGLAGKADAVEFHRKADGVWQAYPVEHKRGKSKVEDCDRIQLCAQAMCLEEMLEQTVPEGALFYGRPRRREQVVFDEGLRLKTTEAAARLRELIRVGRVPAAVYESKKCDSCSLMDLCLPKISQSRSAKKYLERIMTDTA